MNLFEFIAEHGDEAFCFGSFITVWLGMLSILVGGLSDNWVAVNKKKRHESTTRITTRPKEEDHSEGEDH